MKRPVDPFVLAVMSGLRKAGLLILTLLLSSCPSPMNSDSNSTAPQTPNDGSLPVTLSVQSDTTNPMNLLNDSAVSSVTVTAYDKKESVAATANLTKGGTDWNGTIEVPSAGTYTFQAAARDPGGVLRWKGSGDQAVAGAGDSVTIRTVGQIVSIWGGGGHSLVLKADGTVWDWGFNLYGKLGDGMSDGVSFNRDDSIASYVRTYDHLTPFQVLGPNGVGHLSSITAVVADEYDNVALKSDGTVWAWGANWIYGNDSGEIGDDTTTDRFTPTQVSGLSDVTQLGGRGYQTLAVEGNGTVWAWGDNEYGQLGNNSLLSTLVPVQVSTISNPKMVSVGGFFCMALLQDGTVLAWGQDDKGECGNGTYVSGNDGIRMPTEVSGLTDVVYISCGWDHAMAIKSDGTVWCWGNNSNGELGDGTSANSAVPVQTLGLTNIVSVSGGDRHSSALDAKGNVYKWGQNGYGDLGNGTSDNGVHSSPVAVASLSHVTLSASRDYHNLAVEADGSLWTWGNNAFAQCGLGSTSPKLVTTPDQVAPF